MQTSKTSSWPAARTSTSCSTTPTPARWSRSTTSTSARSTPSPSARRTVSSPPPPTTRRCSSGSLAFPCRSNTSPTPRNIPCPPSLRRPTTSGCSARTSTIRSPPTLRRTASSSTARRRSRGTWSRATRASRASLLMAITSCRATPMAGSGFGIGRRAKCSASSSATTKSAYKPSGTPSRLPRSPRAAGTGRSNTGTSHAASFDAAAGESVCRGAACEGSATEQPTRLPECTCERVRQADPKPQALPSADR
mmetsp:Transcript_20545/g.47058  ORF Transcript_20545/g.47058 Transcript_20545/m.47058 type:complete len:251 (-) Transcript_20545:144-896(-)